MVVSSSVSTKLTVKILKEMCLSYPTTDTPNPKQYLLKKAKKIHFSELSELCKRSAESEGRER